MIKICADCGLEKEHNLRSDKKTPYAWCIECMVQYKKNYYVNNKEDYLKRQRATDKRRRERNRELIRKHKDKPCTDCGIKYPWYVMDFDHILENKKNAISHMLGESTKRVQDEINKCEVVCSNCHRERTYQRSSVV